MLPWRPVQVHSVLPAVHHHFRQARQAGAGEGDHIRFTRRRQLQVPRHWCVCARAVSLCVSLSQLYLATSVGMTPLLVPTLHCHVITLRVLAVLTVSTVCSVTLQYVLLHSSSVAMETPRCDGLALCASFTYRPGPNVRHGITPAAETSNERLNNGDGFGTAGAGMASRYNSSSSSSSSTTCRFGRRATSSCWCWCCRKGGSAGVERSWCLAHVQ